MALDINDMVRRVCDGEGEPDFVGALSARIEEVGNFSVAAWMLVSWADNTPSDRRAWAYQKAFQIYSKMGKRGLANLAMRKARKELLTLVSDKGASA